MRRDTFLTGLAVVLAAGSWAPRRWRHSTTLLSGGGRAERAK